MKTEMTLLELSETLAAAKFTDIFDGDVESDCLDLENMTGNWADREGNEIVEFDIVSIDKDSSHLETIISIDLSQIDK